jgi:hypothetical protein
MYCFDIAILINPGEYIHVMTLERKDLLKMLKNKGLSEHGELENQVRQFGSVNSSAKNKQRKKPLYGILILEDLLIECEQIDHSIRGIRRK